MLPRPAIWLSVPLSSIDRVTEHVAVERVFDVNVLKVRIINVRPKRGRYGRRVVIRKPGWKKAIVTLAEGQRIEFFEGV